jgi:Rrf2 family protein
MQFTRAEEYGVFGVVYLADKPRTEVTPLSEISQAQDIPEKFLAKIFQSLSKAGVVRSHRGVRGGFTLGADPENITLKRVLETIQGPYHLMKCLQDPEACDGGKADRCALRAVMAEAEAKMISVFENHTVADLAAAQRAAEANI